MFLNLLNINLRSFLVQPTNTIDKQVTDTQIKTFANNPTTFSEK